MPTDNAKLQTDESADTRRKEKDLRELATRSNGQAVRLNQVLVEHVIDLRRRIEKLEALQPNAV